MQEKSEQHSLFVVTCENIFLPSPQGERGLDGPRGLRGQPGAGIKGDKVERRLHTDTGGPSVKSQAAPWQRTREHLGAFHMK